MEPGPALDLPVPKSPAWLLPAFALAIIVLGAVAYWPGLSNGFTNWDDNWLITENRWIREISVPNVVTIFNPMAPQEIREELGNEFLPVRDLSYSINYALDGYNPRGYQATNLILHLFNSLLVLLLATRLTKRSLLGGLAGLLFALHPVHVEAVSWLSSRKDLLATFFVLLSLNFYLAARLPRTGLMPSESFVQRMRQSTRLSYWLALVFFLLALLSKMHAVVLPALILLVELLRGRSLGVASWSRRGLMQAPFWGIALLFTLLAMKIGQGLMREPYGDSLVSTWLTATAALTRDAQVLVTGTPLQACVDFELHAGVSASVTGGAAILLLLFAAVAGGINASRRGWTQSSQVMLGSLSFGALWFMAALSPVSNFVVQIGTVFADRYLYLPSVGFCLAAAAVASTCWEKSFAKAWGPALRAGLSLAIALVCLGCLWQTSRVVQNWRDSESLWNSVLAQDAGNHTAHFNLAREYHEQALSEGDIKQRDELLQRAFNEYHSALSNPARTYRYDPARVWGALASVEINRNDPAAALYMLNMADKHVDLPWRPKRGQADIEAILSNYRGLALSALGRHKEALAAFRFALSRSARYASYRINLASELARVALGEFSGDESQASGARIDEAVLAEAHTELKRYETERGRDLNLVEAQALILKKEFDARLSVSGKGGDTTVPADLLPLLKSAQAAYREAIALREVEPPNPKAMATLLISAAQAFLPGSPGDKQAESFLRRALALDDSREGVRYLLVRLLQERDDRDSKVEATRLLNEELAKHPEFKPARALRAAGVLQQALNELATLYGHFAPEYTAAHADVKRPSWTMLIRKFSARDLFRNSLDRAIAMLLESLKWDSQNSQLSEILNRSSVEGAQDALALDIGRGLWFFGGDVGRAQSETLMRAAFNLAPADGPLSRFLSGVYLELSEKAVRTGDREELLKLIENMLQLSTTARKVMSIKLINMATDIDGGKAVSNAKGEEFDWGGVEQSQRGQIAAEIMRTALLLDPESIPALNWLKGYYEKEGALDEAIVIYVRFEALLADKPDMLSGVRMALAQCQFDLGQRCVRDYRSALKTGDRDRAGRFAARAIEVLIDSVATCDRELKSVGTPPSHLLRIKGLACQRLAYLDGGRAHYWYSQAIANYERTPLDFPDELAEVRRKRAWFTQDVYQRRKDLQQAITEVELQGKDASDLKEDLVIVENRITLDESDQLRKQDKLEAALERLKQGFNAPNPGLWRLRGEIHHELARRAGAIKDRDRQEDFTVKAAQDFVRASSDPEALILGGELYFNELALAMAEPEYNNLKARVALDKALGLIEDALVALPAGDTKRIALEKLEQRARATLTLMNKLASTLFESAVKALDSGNPAVAMDCVVHSLQVQPDNPLALLLKAHIELEQARKADLEGRSAESQKAAQAAAKSFEQLIESNPPLVRQYLDAQLGMAEALLLLGKRRDALFWLDAAERKLSQAVADKRLLGNDQASLAERINSLRGKAR